MQLLRSFFMRLMVVKDRNVNSRFVWDFCNMLAKRDHEVNFVFDSFKQQNGPSNLLPKVKVRNLSSRKGNLLLDIWSGLKSVFQPSSFRYAKAIKEIKPDVIVCYFLKDVYNVCFLHNHNIPIVLMVHNHPPVFFAPLRNKPIRYRVYKKQLEKIAAYDLLLESFRGTIGEDYPKHEERIIGNIIGQIEPQDRADLSVEKKKIIYVCRVDEVQKRQHLLFEAFGKIAKDFPDWKIELYGSIKHPDYHKRLLEQMKSLGIENQVEFMGYANDVKAVYRGADFMAWPAAYEGLSIALADGQAHGLPAIGFADAPSVNEVIKDGVNGFLAKDVDEFAAKMAMLMKDQNLRIKMGAEAVKGVEQYAENHIADKWEQLLKDLTRK
ncbi:MAG: glycosyltransferase family 4 protein [Alphaproteobacteria bacterium]|nr:glycosyltransferase family 4 protein [Alphaproteobacteria bacterium]